MKTRLLFFSYFATFQLLHTRTQTCSAHTHIVFCNSSCFQAESLCSSRLSVCLCLPFFQWLDHLVFFQRGLLGQAGQRTRHAWIYCTPLDVLQEAMTSEHSSRASIVHRSVCHTRSTKESFLKWMPDEGVSLPHVMPGSGPGESPPYPNRSSRGLRDHHHFW